MFLGGILNAPFSEASFDVITGFHVLEHVSDPNHVIENMWKWLKPGGVLYLHVPNIEALEARIFRSYWYGLELPRHLYHFSPISLSRLFTSFDFDEVLLRTMPDSHIEASMFYVLDELRTKMGVSCSRTVVSGPPGIDWRFFAKHSDWLFWLLPVTWRLPWGVGRESRSY